MILSRNQLFLSWEWKLVYFLSSLCVLKCPAEMPRLMPFLYLSAAFKKLFEMLNGKKSSTAWPTLHPWITACSPTVKYSDGCSFGGGGSVLFFWELYSCSHMYNELCSQENKKRWSWERFQVLCTWSAIEMALKFNLLVGLVSMFICPWASWVRRLSALIYITQIVWDTCPPKHIAAGCADCCSAAKKSFVHRTCSKDPLRCWFCFLFRRCGPDLLLGCSEMDLNPASHEQASAAWIEVSEVCL